MAAPILENDSKNKFFYLLDQSRKSNIPADCSNRIHPISGMIFQSTHKEYSLWKLIIKR